jgi:hypothetical protein
MWVVGRSRVGVGRSRVGVGRRKDGQISGLLISLSRSSQ